MDNPLRLIFKFHRSSSLFSTSPLRTYPSSSRDVFIPMNRVYNAQIKKRKDAEIDTLQIPEAFTERLIYKQTLLIIKFINYTNL